MSVRQTCHPGISVLSPVLHFAILNQQMNVRWKLNEIELEEYSWKSCIAELHTWLFTFWNSKYVLLKVMMNSCSTHSTSSILWLIDISMAFVGGWQISMLYFQFSREMGLISFSQLLSFHLHFFLSHCCWNKFLKIKYHHWVIKRALLQFFMSNIWRLFKLIFHDKNCQIHSL